MSISIAIGGRIGTFMLDVTADLPGRGVTGLVGRSGAGKTSLLRCLAGFEFVPGEIIVDGVTWQDANHLMPPHRRGIGYVAQGAPLLPHLSLRRTLAYAERRRTAAIPIDDAIARTDSAPLLDRATPTLSGGERQRAALCIALVSAQHLLLLDEPLSALDAETRAEMRDRLAALLPTLPIATLLVSHDVSDIDRIVAHRIALRDGRIVSG